MRRNQKIDSYSKWRGNLEGWHLYLQYHYPPRYVPYVRSTTWNDSGRRTLGTMTMCWKATASVNGAIQVLRSNMTPPVSSHAWSDLSGLEKPQSVLVDTSHPRVLGMLYFASIRFRAANKLEQESPNFKSWGYISQFLRQQGSFVTERYLQFATDPWISLPVLWLL